MGSKAKYAIVVVIAYFMPITYGLIVSALGVDANKHWLPFSAGLLVILVLAGIVHWKCANAVFKEEDDKMRAKP